METTELRSATPPAALYAFHAPTRKSALLGG